MWTLSPNVSLSWQIYRGESGLSSLLHQGHEVCSVAVRAHREEIASNFHGTEACSSILVRGVLQEDGLCELGDPAASQKTVTPGCMSSLQLHFFVRTYRTRRTAAKLRNLCVISTKAVAMAASSITSSTASWSRTARSGHSSWSPRTGATLPAAGRLCFGLWARPVPTGQVPPLGTGQVRRHDSNYFPWFSQLHSCRITLIPLSSKNSSGISKIVVWGSFWCCCLILVGFFVNENFFKKLILRNGGMSSKKKRNWKTDIENFGWRSIRVWQS